MSTTLEARPRFTAHSQVVRASAVDAAMRKRRSVPRARVFVCPSVRGAYSYAARAPSSFFYLSNLMMGHGSESPMPSGLPSTSTSDGSHHGTTARTFGSFCILYFHHLMRCPSKIGIFGRYLYGRAGSYRHAGYRSCNIARATGWSSPLSP
jgi:hypothetical protein